MNCILATAQGLPLSLVGVPEMKYVSMERGAISATNTRSKVSGERDRELVHTGLTWHCVALPPLVTCKPQQATHTHTL